MRVLLVDDDADTRDLYRWVFESRGYVVDEAENGEVAIAHAHACRPDLVVLDNDMPVMSGLDAARVLRADPSYAAIPIIMLSGGTRPRAGDIGLCEVFLDKPCTVEELLGRARSLLHLPCAS